jgi:hypothetical protein
MQKQVQFIFSGDAFPSSRSNTPHNEAYTRYSKPVFLNRRALVLSGLTKVGTHCSKLRNQKREKIYFVTCG